MLIQHLPLLCSKRIVLASASPRRSELLRGLGLKVEILPSTFEENLDKSVFANPGEYATETATHKAIEVFRRAVKTGSGRRADLIIAADTVVELHAQVLEKPCDKDDAFRMLSSLSVVNDGFFKQPYQENLAQLLTIVSAGQKHKVYTGVALVLPNPSDPALETPPVVKSFYEETEVEFAELDEEAILAYVASGEPMDKAGAYGIQGIGGSFVKCIRGCYFNIMGFPVHRFSVEVDRLVKSGEIKS